MVICLSYLLAYSCLRASVGEARVWVIASLWALCSRLMWRGVASLHSGLRRPVPKDSTCMVELGLGAACSISLTEAVCGSFPWSLCFPPPGVDRLQAPMKWAVIVFLFPLDELWRIAPLALEPDLL